MGLILDLIFGANNIAQQVIILLFVQLLFIIISLYFFDSKKYYFSKVLISIPPLLGLLFSLVVAYEWNHEVPDWAHVRIIFSLAFSFFLLIMLLVSNINKISKNDIARTLFLYWLTMGSYFVESIPFFVLLWGASFYPLWAEIKEELKDLKHAFFLWHHLFSFLFLAIGCAILSWQKGGLINFSDVHHFYKSPQLKIATILIVIAAFLRSGIFPFHLWIKSCHTINPYPLKITFYFSNIGLYLYYKLCSPLLLDHLPRTSLVLTSIAIVSGVYFANMSFVQKTVRMAFTYIMLGQLSFMFALLEIHDSAVKSLVLTQFFSLSLSYGAIFSLLYLIEQKIGILHRPVFYGLEIGNKNLSLLFLLLCLSVMAFPFSLGFVSEELMFHHMIEHSFIFGLAQVVCSALNGINLYMIYSRIFGGRKNYYFSNTIELSFAQKSGYFFVLGTLIICGIFPQTILKIMLDYI